MLIQITLRLQNWNWKMNFNVFRIQMERVGTSGKWKIPTLIKFLVSLEKQKWYE